MKKILVLHGPNLNRLGLREPEIYGHATLNDINASLQQQCTQANVDLTCMQSNSESALIDAIHKAADAQMDYIIINPGAFTHTSIALRDALLSAAIPFIEVHLSNIHAREEFRKRSYFSDIASGVLCGLGAKSYNMALQAVIEELS